MRVALVHDWLTGMRGGEYVLEAIAELFPRAELFTLLYSPGKVSPVLTSLKRRTSWLQKVPGAEKRYRGFLPLMPTMIEGFDLSGFDLVLSSSHCVAKGVRKAPGAIHVSYVHAPMRYIWDRFEDYFAPGRSSLPVRWAARSVRKRLQQWDRRVSGAERVDLMIANSRFIASQIREAYGRDAKVIHPFADLNRFALARQEGRNFLMVGAFAPYKRIDIAVEAFNRLKLPLIVVGSGQEYSKIKKMAGPTVDIVGSLSNSAIADLMSKCRALIFPGLEDFGITPLEAMAAGVPVIAYGEGGATETVTSETGLFFSPQSVEALMESVRRFQSGEVRFDESACRARAAQFTRERFQREYLEAVSETWTAAGKNPAELGDPLGASWSEVGREFARELGVRGP